jgi:hypothetical protein
VIPLLTLLCLVVIVVCSIAGLGATRWQSRAHERERQAWTAERGQLLDRLMHMEGKPWNLPPLEAEKPVEIPEYPLILDPGEMPYR